MDFLINLFWAVLTIAWYFVGFFLLLGLLGIFFSFIYEFVWKKTLGKLNFFKIEDKDYEYFNVCFSCSLCVIIFVLFYDGSIFRIVEEIASYFK
ncbi:MAG: hypothetical protein IKW45_05305 [Clostridia bacterium]|nr:hypothetical protein [Clostridia bacterium]